MSPRRLLVVHAAIAVVLLGHFRDLATDAEHWPFSSYPMYSYPPPARLEAYLVVGLVEGGNERGKEREFPLIERPYLRPLDAGTLGAALSRMNKQHDCERTLDRALRACLARYDALRQAGRHDGPPLRGARLYRLTWEVGRDGSPSPQPGGRELLHEVLLHER
jgi:hypothetical protein